MLKMPLTLGKSLVSLDNKSVSDLRRSMASGNSHVSESKNWLPKHSKNKIKIALCRGRVRAGGDLLGSEKPGWSAGGDTR